MKKGKHLNYYLNRISIKQKVLLLRTVPVDLFLHMVSDISAHERCKKLSIVVQKTISKDIDRLYPYINKIVIYDSIFKLWKCKGNWRLFKSLKDAGCDLIVLPYGNIDGAGYLHWEIFLLLTGIKSIGANRDLAASDINLRSIAMRFFKDIIMDGFALRLLWYILIPFFFTLSFIEPAVLRLVHFICHFQDNDDGHKDSI